MKIKSAQILVWSCICVFICFGCDNNDGDSLGPQTIVGVETSTTGFIGVVADDVTVSPSPGAVNQSSPMAPVEEPQLITNWSEFVKAFGEIQSGNLILAHAVKGFFKNGGKRCWVIRVASSSDLSDPTDELSKFESIDEIAIVTIPGAITSTQYNAILEHCFKMVGVALLKPAEFMIFKIHRVTAGP